MLSLAMLGVGLGLLNSQQLEDSGEVLFSTTCDGPSLIYLESTIRSRTQYILANAERLESMPFDGIVVNIPASWLAMSGQRWTYDANWSSWIEPIVPVLFDDAHGMTEHYLLATVDRPAGCWKRGPM